MDNKAAERRSMITQVRQRMAETDESARRACLALGFSPSQYSRWSRRFDDLGDDGLADGERSGRPCSWAALLQDEKAAAKLRTIYIATIGAASQQIAGKRRTAKVATTLLLFADEPECPAELGKKLARGYQPQLFIRFLRRLTPEQENKIRGSKHFQNNGLKSLRDMTVRLPDGSRAEITAGFCLEFDDMSSNQPFFVSSGEGHILSRQGLYARDVRSGRWLGVELVARPREAYRAEDILRFFRRLFSSIGKPDVIRLEKGIWRARSIRGFAITETGAITEEVMERPAMDENERQLLQDGLTAIGITVQYVSSSHAKGGVESGFNYLQTILATKTQEFQNVGRYAGEFELPAKQLRRQRAGSHHPEQLKFAPMDVLAQRIEDTMVWINKKITSRLKRETSLETPDQVWERDLERRPLAPLVASDLPAFLPHVRQSTVQGGAVTVKVDGRPHLYRHDELERLGAGYRVYIRFDFTDPALGCAIYNREQGDRSVEVDGGKEVTRALREGEFICLASYEIPAPQLDVTECPAGLVPETLEQRFGKGSIDQGNTRRRTQDRAVRTAVRVLAKPGQPAIKAATARDGRGNVAEVSGGTSGKGQAAREKARAANTATRPAQASPPNSELPTPRTESPASHPNKWDRLARAMDALSETQERENEKETIAQTNE